jgi:hypothetical protein
MMNIPRERYLNLGAFLDPAKCANGKIRHTAPVLNAAEMVPEVFEVKRNLRSRVEIVEACKPVETCVN